MDPIVPYWRFSSPGQEDGDSLRRQEAEWDAYLKQSGDKPLLDFNYIDKGMSGFHGTHRKKGAMGRLLADIEAGRLPVGTKIGLENLDRFSREEPWDAGHHFLDLIYRGYKVQIIVPPYTCYCTGADPFLIHQALLELNRGHWDSKRKQGIGTANWDHKKHLARTEGETITKRVPGWIRVVDGRREPIPERVALIEEMVGWCLEGCGASAIVKRLSGRGEPTWGRGKKWTKRYVQKILKSRALLGEHQPKKGKKIDGEVLPTYWPILLDVGRFQQVQRAFRTRRSRPGPRGERVESLFTGLIFDARSRERMQVARQTRGVKGKRVKAQVLIPAGAQDGRAAAISFPYPTVFEPAVLARLREIDPADLLEEEPTSEAAELTAKKRSLELALKDYEDEAAALAKPAKSLARTMANLEAQLEAIQGPLEEALQREANPKSVAWAEVKTLLQLAQDPAARLRLRTMLREVIEAIWILIVRIGSHALAAVQIHFSEGASRNYLIHYWAAGNKRAGGYRVLSSLQPAGDRPEQAPLDLRKPEDAAALEAFLRTLEPADLKAAARA